MAPRWASSCSRTATTLWLAAWLAGCASMASAPTPPATGALPPTLQRVAVVASPEAPSVRIDGLDKGEGALQGAADGATLLLQGGGCGDPMSCCKWRKCADGILRLIIPTNVRAHHRFHTIASFWAFTGGQLSFDLDLCRWLFVENS